MTGPRSGERELFGDGAITHFDWEVRYVPHVAGKPDQPT